MAVYTAFFVDPINVYRPRSVLASWSSPGQHRYTSSPLWNLAVTWWPNQDHTLAVGDLPSLQEPVGGIAIAGRNENVAMAGTILVIMEIHMLTRVRAMWQTSRRPFSWHTQHLPCININSREHSAGKQIRKHARNEKQETIVWLGHD